MARTNRTRYALLGMLSLGDSSGYDLAKGFREPELAHFWSESVGQIYPALRALRNEGLVSASEEERVGRRNRTVYAITPLGRRTLRSWLNESAEEELVRNEFLLKLYFASELEPGEALDQIKNYRNQLATQMEIFREDEGDLTPSVTTPEDELYRRLVKRAGRHLLHARHAWCQEAEKAIRDMLETQKAIRKKK